MTLSPDNRLFVTDMFNRTDNRRGVVYIFDQFDRRTYIPAGRLSFDQQRSDGLKPLRYPPLKQFEIGLLQPRRCSGG